MTKQRLSKRQTLLVIILSAVIFVLGVLIGSIGTIGSTIRGLVYGARGEIDLSTVQEIYGILRRDFDGTLNNDALRDGAKTGLVAATDDPFTNYLNPQATATLMQRMRGNGFVGIGVELGFKNGKLVIIAPQEGSPAEQAGIRAGDVVLAIDNRMVSEMSEEEAVQALRGESGSTVILRVQRDNKQLDFTITRQPITIPSVRSSISDTNIGILTITTFDNNTVRLAREAAAAFNTKNVRGIILDMRNNGGGAVTAAQGVLGLWLPKGSLVMTEKRGDTILRTYKTETDPSIGHVKTIILLNGNSASASEVVAGALREYGVATILGTQSFGKGSVQEVRPLSNSGSLIFTVSRWFTPKGNSIDGSGITPDVVVESGNVTPVNDPQLDAAEKKLL